MTMATAGMVVVTLALTVFAGPLLDMCLRAGETIADGVSLVQLQEQVGEE
jgi:multicomponent Na+:H+ antiporter subunit D